MMREDFPIKHVFVDRVPAVREERIVYVSIPFRTAVHNCMCGCGTKIVTPLRPPQWKLTFDGDTISLWPSIGNSGLACESHYVIDRDRVLWYKPWTEEEIEQGRARDKSARDSYYRPPPSASPTAAKSQPEPASVEAKVGIWGWLKKLLK